MIVIRTFCPRAPLSPFGPFNCKNKVINSSSNSAHFTSKDMDESEICTLIHQESLVFKLRNVIKTSIGNYPVRRSY